MKTLAALLVLCFIGLSSLTACDGKLFSRTEIEGSGNVIKVTRPLTGFTGISAGGAIELIVVAQQDFKVEVETDDNIMEHITTTVSGGILEITMDESYSYSNATVKVYVSLPNLARLDVSGASTATVTHVNSEELTIDVSGASRVTTEGTSKRLHGDVSGASSLKAEKLSAEQVTIDASGASNSYVTATEFLTADASGASSIYYYGNPKNTQVETSGASAIKRR